MSTLDNQEAALIGHFRNSLDMVDRILNIYLEPAPKLKPLFFALVVIKFALENPVFANDMVNLVEKIISPGFPFQTVLEHIAENMQEDLETARELNLYPPAQENPELNGNFVIETLESPDFLDISESF